ncbi:MAG: ABC transporter permease, partial [Verrucomicrobiae bacterium]|nr:ABC transporter permease [Verrucomicrobiae bacterium]
TIAAVIPANGAGRFSLQANQQLPRNAFVPLASLQRALKLAGRANAILVGGEREAESLQAILRSSLTLDDLDLRTRINPARGYVALESRRMILEPVVVSAALAVAKDLNLSAAPTLTHLANTVAVGAREIPYSTVTARDDGIQRLKDDEILLNDWAANDLGARPGDAVRLDYYVVGPRGELLTTNHVFKLAGVVPLSGAAGDPMLTPDYPGIANTKNISDWDPPFPVDLKRVRQKDEDYWDAHRGTPKAFVSLATGQRLWSSRFGNLTSIRLSSGRADVPPAETDLRNTATRFERGLLARLSPDQLGLVFQPVKEQGLRAAAGATDFGQLFLCFSVFLIFSAAMLVALLFRLGIERRAKEIGILLATGLPARVVRRLLLLEGGAIAVFGSALGLAGAVGYGALMLAGLRTWWLPAVGTPFLKLDVTAGAMTIGGAGGLLVALASIGLTLRALRKQSPAMLIAGKHDDADRLVGDERGARRRWIAAGIAALGLWIGRRVGFWWRNRGCDGFSAGWRLVASGGPVVHRRVVPSRAAPFDNALASCRLARRAQRRAPSGSQRAHGGHGGLGHVPHHGRDRIPSRAGRPPTGEIIRRWRVRAGGRGRCAAASRPERPRGPRGAQHPAGGRGPTVRRARRPVPIAAWRRHQLPEPLRA